MMIKGTKGMPPTRTPLCFEKYLKVIADIPLIFLPVFVTLLPHYMWFCGFMLFSLLFLLQIHASAQSF